jgi:hypothetical protein
LTFSADSGDASLNVLSGASGNFTVTTKGNQNTFLLSNLLIDHNGSGQLTIGRSINGNSLYSVTKNGAGELILNAASVNATAFILNDGKLTLNNNDNLGAFATLTINGGSIDVTAARSTTNNNAQIWNGDFTFAGGNTWVIGTGNVTLGGNCTVTVIDSSMSVGGNVTGVGFALTKAGQGF